MENLKLYDLIRYLELGTNLHIGVLFFGSYGNEFCELPFSHQIHSSPFCTHAKNSTKNGYRRCFACRNLAIKKALDTKLPFGGRCINGLFEYVHPVIVNGDVACVIFIGNIRSENEKRRDLLLETLENNFSESDCKSLSQIIESYILLLFEKYGYNAKSANSLIENVKNYILSNIEFDINASQIAGIFHYNEAYLGRLFKKETGIGINDYINFQRIEIAKKRLSTTCEKVIDISSGVGFNNVTYFNRVFKKHTGLSPIEYRKKADR